MGRGDDDLLPGGGDGGEAAPIDEILADNARQGNNESTNFGKNINDTNGPLRIVASSPAAAAAAATTTTTTTPRFWQNSRSVKAASAASAVSSLSHHPQKDGDDEKDSQHHQNNHQITASSSSSSLYKKSQRIMSTHERQRIIGGGKKQQPMAESNSNSSSVQEREEQPSATSADGRYAMTKSSQQTAGTAEAQQKPATSNEAVAAAVVVIPASPLPSSGDSAAARSGGSAKRTARRASPLALRLAMKQQRSASATRQRAVGAQQQSAVVEDDSVVLANSSNSRSSKRSTISAASAENETTASSLSRRVRQESSAGGALASSSSSIRSKQQHYGSTSTLSSPVGPSLEKNSATVANDDGRVHDRSTKFSPLRKKIANNTSKQQRSISPFSLAAARNHQQSRASKPSPSLQAAGEQMTSTTTTVTAVRVAAEAAASRTLSKSVKQQPSTTTTCTTTLSLDVVAVAVQSSSSSSLSSPPKDHPRSTSSTRRRFMATRQRFQHQEQQQLPQGAVKITTLEKKTTLSKQDTEDDILTRKTRPTGRAPASVTTTAEETTRSAAAPTAAHPVVVMPERRSEKVKRRQRSLSATRSVVASSCSSSSIHSSMDSRQEEKQHRSESVPRATRRPRGGQEQEEQQSSTAAAAASLSLSPLRATDMAVILSRQVGGGSTLRYHTKSRTDLMRRARAQSRERAQSRNRQRNDTSIDERRRRSNDDNDDGGSESESDASSFGGKLLKKYSNDSDSSLGKNLLSKLDDVEKKLISKLTCSPSKASPKRKTAIISSSSSTPQEDDHHAGSMSAAAATNGSSPSQSLFLPSSTASLDKNSCSSNIKNNYDNNTSHSTTLVDDDNSLVDSPRSPPKIRSTMSNATSANAVATLLPSLSPATSTRMAMTVHRKQHDEEPQEAAAEAAAAAASPPPFVVVESPIQSQFTNLQREDALATASQSASSPPAQQEQEQQVHETPSLSPAVAAAAQSPPLPLGQQQQQQEEEEEVLPPISMESHCTVLPTRKEEEETSRSSTSSPIEASEGTAQHLMQITEEAEEAAQSTAVGSSGITMAIQEKQQEGEPQLSLLPDCTSTTLSLTPEEQVRQEEKPSLYSSFDSEPQRQNSQELSPLADTPQPFTPPLVPEKQAHHQQQEDLAPLIVVESLQATPSLFENEQIQQQKDETFDCSQSNMPVVVATKDEVLSSSTRTTPSPDEQEQPQEQKVVPAPPKPAQHQQEQSHQEKEDISLPLVEPLRSAVSGVQQGQPEEQNGEVLLLQFQKLQQPQHNNVTTSSLSPNLAPQKTQHEPEQQKEEEASSPPPPKVVSPADGVVRPAEDQNEQHQQLEEETSPSSPLPPFRTALEHQRLLEGEEVSNPKSLELLLTMPLNQERREPQQMGETSPSRHSLNHQNKAQSVGATTTNNPGSPGASNTKEDLLIDGSSNPKFKTRVRTLSPKRSFLSNMTAESPGAASPTKGSNPLPMRRYTSAHIATHKDADLAVPFANKESVAYVRSKLRRTGVLNIKSASSEEKEQEKVTVSHSTSFETSGDGKHAKIESLESDVQQGPGPLCDEALAQRIDAIIFDHKLPEQEIVNTIVRKLRVELSPGQQNGKSSSSVSLEKNAAGSPPKVTKQREEEAPSKTSRPNDEDELQTQSPQNARIKTLANGRPRQGHCSPGATDTMDLREMKSLGSILSETSSAESTLLEVRFSYIVEDDTKVAHSKEKDGTGIPPGQTTISKEVEADDTALLKQTEGSVIDPEKSSRTKMSTHPIVGCTESGRREEVNSPPVDYVSDSDSDDEFDVLEAVAQAMGTYPPPPPPSIPKKSRRKSQSSSSPSQETKPACLPTSSAVSQQEVVKSTVRLPPLHRAATPPPPPPPPGKKKKRNRHTHMLPTTNDAGAGRVKNPTISPIEQTSKVDTADAQKSDPEWDDETLKKFHAFWLNQTDGEAVMSVVNFDMGPSSSGMTTDTDEKKTDETPPDETTHTVTLPSALHAEQNSSQSLPSVPIKPRTDPAAPGIDVLGEISNDGHVQTSSESVVVAHVSEDSGEQNDFMSTPTRRKEKADYESGKHVEESLSSSFQSTDPSCPHSRSPLKDQPISPASTPVVFEGTKMVEKADIAISAVTKFYEQVSHSHHSPVGAFSSWSETQNSGEASNKVPSSVNLSSPEQTRRASVYESLKETPRAKTRTDKRLIVPASHPSPFEAAISYRPHILSYILGFLGDPVMVSRAKELNRACYEYVDENEHELMQAAVRLGGMSMNTRPAFWLWVTLGKFGAPKRIVPSAATEAGLRRRDELVKLERIGRSGKWHSVIERDVHRAFGNLPPHKTGARLRTDSIVRALVTWGKSRTIKTGVRGTGDPPPVSRDPSTDYDSDDISLAPTDTVSDWGGVSPVGSFTNNSFSSDTEKDKNSSIPNADKKESRSKRTDDEMALSGNSLTEESKKILQNKLSFVLHALSAAHSDIGYCQGMDYVVAHLLRILQETVRWSAARGTLPKAILSAPKVSKLTPGMAEDAIADLFAEVDRSLVIEEACFRMMDTFFTCYNLGHFYYPELRCLKTCCLVFEKLIQIKLPTLADHFEHHELNVGLFALGWFQTLFLYLPSMPTATVCHMWDIWLVERSYKIFFRVGTAILFLSQPILLNHELEGMMSYLNTFPDATLLSPDILIACALQIKVTNGMLMELEQQVAQNGS